MNLPEIATILSAATGAPIVMAAIREMPEELPKTLNGWWKYLRATLQQYLSMKGVQSDPSTKN
jgi:K+-transporting ATPase A subunit